ncbi:MAG: lysostaphin resistance A-like protein [Thermoplasmata archaeon]
MIAFILLLAVNSGYLFWGMSQVIPGIMGEQCAGCAVTIYILSPFPLILLRFDEPSWFLLYYFALLIIISVSILLAVFLDGRRLVSDMMTSIGKGRLKFSTKSSWAIAGQLFCAYLFFTMAYIFFLGLFGAKITSPEMGDAPLWYVMFELANASVYEEIVTRLAFLGIPMFLIALGSGIRDRGLLKNLFGGSGNMTTSTWALIIVSAAVFGAAHIPHWDIYKLVPTFMGGLILGYVYVKRGIWASILFHFAVDYYTVSFFVSSSDPGHTGILAFLVIATVVFVIAGFFFFTYYFVKVVKLAGSVLGIPRPTPASVGDAERRSAAQQDLERMQQFGFLCSRCGFPEARYSDGRFQCLRCGYIQ